MSGVVKVEVVITQLLRGHYIVPEVHSRVGLLKLVNAVDTVSKFLNVSESVETL